MIALKCPKCGVKLGFANDSVTMKSETLAELKCSSSCGFCKTKLTFGQRMSLFRNGYWENDGKWFEKDYQEAV